MIPLKSNLGLLLRLWARLYIDSRTSASLKKKRPNGRNDKGRMARKKQRQLTKPNSSLLMTPKSRNSEAESIGRRRKLVLPTAQVGKVELEDIVKIGQAGENAKALVVGGSDASGRLLSDYEGLETARMARTPRTAPQCKYFPVGFAILFHRAHTS